MAIVLLFHFIIATYLPITPRLFHLQPMAGATGYLIILVIAADLFAGCAGDIGLDGEEFSSCLLEHNLEHSVQADIQEARELGITETPAFHINGHTLFGAQPFEVFV